MALFIANIVALDGTAIQQHGGLDQVLFWMNGAYWARMA